MHVGSKWSNSTVVGAEISQGTRSWVQYAVIVAVSLQRGQWVAPAIG
jgi:hypothetical protein